MKKVPVKIFLLTLALASLSACSTQGINTITNKGIDYRPILDTKGLDLLAYEKDLAECKEFAKKIDPSSELFAQAVGGAVAGAAVGAVVGDTHGDASYGAEVGAKYGATAGTMRGYAGALSAQEHIIRNCITGRGYKILY